VTNHLVLLPGLDGTGQLFANFVAALPDTFIATTVTYPADKFLSYTDLLPFVRSVVPTGERFIILAESFSSPIAIEYAASNPQNLAALVIVAGFVRKPVGRWSPVAKALTNPWIFKPQMPRWLLEFALVGSDAPAALVQEFRRVVQLIDPAVLSGRAREALDCDMTLQLAQINVPLMYVQADHDRLLSESCVAGFKRIRPAISLAFVDRPHLVLQREPQQVADVVSKFTGDLKS
jgi:pimeloyl-ACP methyl ester carboxylesterase